MNITDSPFLFCAAIIIGVVAQQVLAWLKQHNKKTAYTIIRPVVLLYWIALGVLMMIGGAEQLQGNLLASISGIALGLGLMLSGISQTLKLEWLKTARVVVLSVGPVASGVSFIESGNALGGMIALALGLGILVSVLKGWPGGVGQMVIGAVIIGSSAMLLIGALVTNTIPADFVTVAIGVAMLALGLWVIGSGGVTVIGSIRQPTQAASLSES